MAAQRNVSPGGSGGGAWIGGPRTASSNKWRNDGGGMNQANEKVASFKSQGRLTALMKTGNSAEVSADEATGTSIFDPVLCELAYRWFCPVGGMVLDPFAGGSVRGIVAGILGRKYHGVELRQEQVAANEQQRGIAPSGANITWVCGDSEAELKNAPQADFVFGCPPYGDLEVYSDDPRDLSSMDYPAFIASLRSIIKKACDRLHNDRFACFVVGDIRAKDGTYRGFVVDTVQAFRDAGLKLYNDAILVTAVGSLPIRTGRMFSASRKMGKTHQNVLVFVKGDHKKATDAVGPVDVADLEEQYGEPLNVSSTTD